MAFSDYGGIHTRCKHLRINRLHRWKYVQGRQVRSETQKSGTFTHMVQRRGG